MEEVLDSAYSLSTLEEEELFDEKQKFMHFVFDRVLKSNKGKAFVRQHKDNYDTQSIFAKLVEYCAKSTRATLPYSTSSYLVVNDLSCSKLDSNLEQSPAFKKLRSTIKEEFKCVMENIIDSEEVLTIFR